MNSFLTFTKSYSTGKTDVYVIQSNGSTLGTVRWYAGWRRYTLQPSSGTVWDAKCLTEVTEFLERLMLERDPAHQKLQREAAAAMVADMYGDTD